MEQREEITKESQNQTAAELGARTADLYAIFQDVMKNFWMVLLVAVSAAFLTYIGPICSISLSSDLRLHS